MSQLTIEQAFQQALRQQQAGNLHEAEQICRQVLASYPGHAEALHLLGVIACQVRRHDLAVDLLRQAIAHKRHYAEAYSDLGLVLGEMGQLDDAIGAYRQAIAYKPGLAEAHNNLGNALREKGELEEAIGACRQAIALQANYAEAHNNLGNALREQGQVDEAIAAYRRAIALKANYPEAYNNLGVVLKDKGQVDEAIAAYRRALALEANYAEAASNLGMALKDKGQLDEAIADLHAAISLNPHLAEAHYNLGIALRDAGHQEEAITAYREAIALEAQYPEAYNNLGNALTDLQRLDEAVAAYQQAIALDANYADAHYNLGNVFRELGRLEETMAANRQAIALAPNFAEAHYHLALSLLARGEYHRGWEEYEWRWQCKDLMFPRRDFAQKQWDGSSLEGRTILLHDEQGFGDTLQFIRYLALVERRGGRVIVECQRELRRLLQSMDALCRVVAQGDSLPYFDVHCALPSLPRIFGTTVASIPRNVPYLQAEAVEVEKWRGRLADGRSAIKVGLTWAGNQTHRIADNRSMTLGRFALLARAPGVRFYSLQKGPAAEDATVPAGMELIDVMAEVSDFADTAGLIANLDLVITVDTAVAHLAGAMGKAVWTLLPFAADWRWLLDRADSPWYPSMRLFRQPAIGDWDSVMWHVAEAWRDFRENPAPWPCKTETGMTTSNSLPRRPYSGDGAAVSVIGFGGILVMNATQEDANRLVGQAIEAGVNYFDVAPTYGNAEERLGPALEPYRQKCFLACKTTCRDAVSAREQLAGSLRRLRTDHFDLYQLHGLQDMSKDVDAAFGKGGVIEMVEEAKKSGVIRHVGFSVHSAACALAALERFPFDSILMPVNFATFHAGQFGPGVLAEARRRSVTILALKSMARQAWPAAYPKGHPERQRFAKCWYQPLTDPTEIELAVRFTLSQSVAALLPPGEEELFWRAVEIARRFKPITEAELQTLRQMAAGLDPLFGRSK